MSTYNPKIDISQFGDTKKVRTENANGEIQLLIEKAYSNPDTPSEQYTQPDLGPLLIVT
jgi:hypothetical protein